MFNQKLFPCLHVVLFFVVTLNFLTLLEALMGEVSPRSSLRLRSKGEKHEETEELPSSGMSLDVLAQVASETLENEPNSPQIIKPKKVGSFFYFSYYFLGLLQYIVGLVYCNTIPDNITYYI